MWFGYVYRSLLAVATTGLLLGVEAGSQARGPLSSIQTLDSAIIKTPFHTIHSNSHFDLEFDIQDRNQKVKLTLEPNHDIIPHNAGISILNAAGEPVAWEPLDRSAHRIFKGTTWILQGDGIWAQQGWSRITMLQDGPEPIFEGSFSIWHDSHHIQLRSKFAETRHDQDPSIDSVRDGPMILFRDSDTFSHPWHGDLRKRDQDVLACPSDELEFNTDPLHPVHASFTDVLDYNTGNVSLARRQSIDGGTTIGNAGNVNYASTIGQVRGCPSTRKVALVGVAVDCTYRAMFNSRNDTQQHIITVMNQASQVYESTFNITLALKNLTISESDCPATAQAATPWNVPCNDNITLSNRLNTFSSWRGQYQDNNAFWMLLTRCTTGAEVGLSWLGQLCINGVTNVGGQSTSSANVVARTSSEWQVIAHETGHMFGAVHDCDSSLCASSAAGAQQCCPLSATTCNANAQYIMNPSTGTNIQAFSACTVGNICGAFYRKSVSNACLVDNRNIPELITGQQCGNGIVEGDEECDCGGSSGCGNNPCCNPTTCKFIGNAVCDDANEVCCRGCQLASNGTVCRASTGVCDPGETCTGRNATCPVDVTTPDGQDCGSGLKCASGQCTSRDLQCKTLMGSLSTNNDTYACDQNSCQLTCASPQIPANKCYSLSQYFVDGTPCGSGTCQNGQCTGSSTAGDIQQFFTNNRQAVIIGGSVAGGVIALLILCCVIRSCRRRNKARKMPPPAPLMQQQWPAGSGGRWQSPQQAPPRYGGSPAHGPVTRSNSDFPQYNQEAFQQQQQSLQQRNSYAPPATPGAVYDQRGSGLDQDGQRRPMFYGGNSVRYA